MRILFKEKKGFTFIELLVAVFILALGIISTINFFITAQASTKYAQDLTVAATHAESVLESMRTKTALAQITATDWAAWAQGSGLNTLPSESYSVTYPSGTDANPLDAQVIVSWVRNSRTNSVSFATKMTE